MKLVDKNLNFDIESLKIFLNVEFDKTFFNKSISNLEVEKKLFEYFGYDSVKRWAREKPYKNSLKKSSFGEPENAGKIFGLSGILDIDPFILYKVNYDNWAKFLKSLGGNISMSNIINFGKIHKNLVFLDYFFSPLSSFPSSDMLDFWNKKREQEIKHNWFNEYFESNLKENEEEREQLILINYSKKNQVIHFSYKNDKPLKTFEFWQEYKLIFIRDIEDVLYFLKTTDLWNSKSEEEKTILQKNMYFVLVLNIIGGIKFDFINKNDPILIKTRFMEPKTKFHVSSAHQFEMSLLNQNTNNYIEFFEKPC